MNSQGVLVRMGSGVPARKGAGQLQFGPIKRHWVAQAGPDDAPQGTAKPVSRRKKWMKRVRRTLYGALAFIGLTPMVRESPGAPRGPEVKGDPAKPAFVIHSGFSDVYNSGGWNIAVQLQDLSNYGYPVKPENIVILDNIYPKLPLTVPPSELPKLILDGWKQHLSDVAHLRMPSRPILADFIESLHIFFSATSPDSTVVDQQYNQMKRILKEKGLENAEVILLGHSSGGQIVMSMAGKNAQNEVDPAKITTVVAIATPVMGCHTPKEMKVFTVASKEDEVVGTLKSIQGALGMKLVSDHPERQDPNHFAIDFDWGRHMEMARFGYLFIYVLKNHQSDAIEPFWHGKLAINGLKIDTHADGGTQVTTPDGTTYLKGLKVGGDGPEKLEDFLRQNPQFARMKIQ